MIREFSTGVIVLARPLLKVWNNSRKGGRKCRQPRKQGWLCCQRVIISVYFESFMKRILLIRRISCKKFLYSKIWARSRFKIWLKNQPRRGTSSISLYTTKDLTQNTFTLLFRANLRFWGSRKWKIMNRIKSRFHRLMIYVLKSSWWELKTESNPETRLKASSTRYAYRSAPPATFLPGMMLWRGDPTRQAPCARPLAVAACSRFPEMLLLVRFSVRKK